MRRRDSRSCRFGFSQGQRGVPENWFSENDKKTAMHNPTIHFMHINEKKTKLNVEN